MRTLSQPFSRNRVIRPLALIPVCAAVVAALFTAPAASASPAGTAMVWTSQTGAVPLASVPVIKPETTESGIPVFNVTKAGLLSGIHKCVSIGGNGTTEGVFCADLWAAPIAGSGAVNVAPALEGLCQADSNSTIVQCNAIDAEMFTAAGNGARGDLINKGCSPDDPAQPACPDGRFKPIGNDDPMSISDVCDVPGTESEVWTVVQDGDDITLPGDDATEILRNNLASQHAIVC